MASPAAQSRLVWAAYTPEGKKLTAKIVSRSSVGCVGATSVLGQIVHVWWCCFFTENQHGG
jgi:hypothetical protein